ncbi:hypothetical protein P0W64_15150 [Tsukamurella sp. 8F]|uniref:hypothetical protein n=1 Tax=unclassified Tsukamurella TaxID=2633480 RepID=UPI0023BA1957|nr:MULTISPECIES: hypothetical protein [unclassified Tsukamurella]MDF0529136.1 hypothetical protein [Tsukamurella sp. 8J]MDF0588114.1 hypothetical protein [Tsukamurella sp. 8F]
MPNPTSEPAPVAAPPTTSAAPTTESSTPTKARPTRRAAPTRAVVRPVHTSSLEASFASVRRAAGAPVGVAFVAGGGTKARVLGDDVGGDAYSTIKVPIAVTVQRKYGDDLPSDLRSDMSDAIVHSDNDAADELWADLGRGYHASAAVREVLRAGNDDTTVPDPLNGWGATDWTDADQAVFAANLACIRGAGPVLSLMRQTDDTQRWGVADLDGVAVKGGWSPGDDGGYVVRQLAVVKTPKGQTGIAMSTRARTMDAGTAVLDRVGAWLRTNLTRLPSGHC